MLTIQIKSIKFKKKKKKETKLEACYKFSLVIYKIKHNCKLVKTLQVVFKKANGEKSNKRDRKLVTQSPKYN